MLRSALHRIARLADLLIARTHVERITRIAAPPGLVARSIDLVLGRRVRGIKRHRVGGHLVVRAGLGVLAASRVQCVPVYQALDVFVVVLRVVGWCRCVECCCRRIVGMGDLDGGPAQGQRPTTDDFAAVDGSLTEGAIHA